MKTLILRRLALGLLPALLAWPTTVLWADENPAIPATTPDQDFKFYPQDADYPNDGTTYHKKTGLTWNRCAEGQSWSWDRVNKIGTCTGTANTYTWQAALSLATDGWRLPNQKELNSILELARGGPAINATVFPNTPSSSFWSASPYAPDAYRAWSVVFDNGIGGAGDKGYSLAVRLVRGGQYSLLSVTKGGDGDGTVTSNPPGIDCGPYCKGSFANEMFATAGEIILTATADANSVFDGWEGCTPLAEGNRCTFTLSTAADTSVTAKFSPKSQWTLYGFYQPVDMNVWNTVKGGSTVPFKFEVFAGPTELTDVAVIDSFTANGATCPGASTPTDDIEFTTTGGTSLRYDPVAGQFIQNWKTPKKPGTCYEVIMKTDDGSTLSAFFILK